MFKTIERVSALLAERHMTYEDLARRCGIAPVTLRNAQLRGTQLSLTTVELICEALDIPLWKFFMPPEDLPQSKGGLPQ